MSEGHWNSAARISKQLLRRKLNTKTLKPQQVASEKQQAGVYVNMLSVNTAEVKLN